MICRSCKSINTVDVLSLGNQYLSDFREDDILPPLHPLDLVYCKDCHFVQLRKSAPLSEMYTPRYGFKSGVNDTIKADLKLIVNQACSYIVNNAEEETYGIEMSHYINRPVAVDIGANDGTLLSNYGRDYLKIGFEPVKKLADECKHYADHVVNNFYNLKDAEEVLKGQKAHIITSISMFYDVEDPDKFVSEVKNILHDEGVWVIQQNYLLATLTQNAYDNICHEHIGYHSLLSLNHLFNRHDLEVVDVSTSNMNGGAIKTVVRHKGVSPVQKSVEDQLRLELEAGIDKIKTYHDFSKRVNNISKKIHDLIKSINSEGKKVFIYGASTRGGTVWQDAGLDVNLIPYAVDRNPEKVGKKIASIGVPIISEDEARKLNPEYMFVSIWFFKDETVFREREYLQKGGTLIFPLPELLLVTKDGERKI